MPHKVGGQISVANPHLPEPDPANLCPDSSSKSTASVGQEGFAMAPETTDTTCCVVGGGPAGMMLGYLLARRGVPVTVMEKHNDFFRDFRGDTVHPSTLEVLKELGLLDEFLTLPHTKVDSLGVIIGGTAFDVVDFSHVPATCKFVALMPQWDFLNFLSRHAQRFPAFQLLMDHEATDLLRDGDRITGVVAKDNGREVQIRADLVVGCDGRHSITRRAAKLDIIEYGVPIDVLWFRISRNADDRGQLLGNVNYGKALILIDRSDYFQAGLIIAKGTFDEIKARGLEALRDDIRRIAPYLGERVNEIKNWDQIKILTVQINRLPRWYLPGLLCIGDAAHAMSPAGGVGINLAIQDAIATANLLTQPLLEGNLCASDLAAVQRRRELPSRITQTIQIVAHRGLAGVFKNPGQLHAPWQLKAATQIPGIQRAVGRAVGMGARPEHARDQDLARPQQSRVKRALFAGIGAAAAAVAISCLVWKAWNRSSEAAG
jgi:2-polyprenyl-6-methoxyphenol hydroxylase-like FAD-dependent oxidoreductase